MTHNQKHTTCTTFLKAESDRRSGRYVHNTQQTQETNITLSADFEPTIPSIERPQTYASDLTATQVGQCQLTWPEINNII